MSRKIGFENFENAMQNDWNCEEKFVYIMLFRKGIWKKCKTRVARKLQNVMSAPIGHNVVAAQVSEGISWDWEEMCKVELPVPSLEEQRNIVKAYNAVSERIAIKRQINDNLAA